MIFRWLSLVRWRVDMALLGKMDLAMDVNYKKGKIEFNIDVNI